MVLWGGGEDTAATPLYPLEANTTAGKNAHNSGGAQKNIDQIRPAQKTGRTI